MSPPNGYWQVQHDDLHALLRRRDLSRREIDVVLFIADATLGHGVKEAEISAQDIADGTGMMRKHVTPVLTELTRKEILVSTPPPEAHPNTTRCLRRIVWPVGIVAPKLGLFVAPKSGATLAPKSGATHILRHEDIEDVCAQKRTPSKKANKQPSDVTAFKAWWSERYQQAQGTAYVWKHAQDGGIIKKLLAQVPLDELKDAADILFAGGLPWATGVPSIGLLSSGINDLRKLARKSCPEWTPAQYAAAEAAERAAMEGQSQ
jgi:phage replication O-like protein O